MYDTQVLSWIGSLRGGISAACLWALNFSAGSFFPYLVCGGRLAQAEGDSEYLWHIPALNHLLGHLPSGCKSSWLR